VDCIVQNPRQVSNLIVNNIFIDANEFSVDTGLMTIEPKIFGDERGWFLETYQKEKYAELGIDADFVQDNMSYSRCGVLRGLHLQDPLQDKLVQVIKGTIYDVAVDVRKESLTFGKWYGVFLSDKNRKQFWIPKGFAHGFLVLSEDTVFSYKCTEYYNPNSEVVIAWNDPTIGIDWPLPVDFENKPIKPNLSAKDKEGLSLVEYKSTHR
jgi:dTDP-4-dehydrorhamnose 3,5-epimerase